MKNYKQTFTITFEEKTGFMDLTSDVQECVRRSNIRDGIITINSMHTTAAVVTAPCDEEKLKGFVEYYQKLTESAPEELRPALCHQLAGGGVTAAIIDGEISLGYTQYVIYIDFDGTREKSVEINIVGE